MNIKEKLLATLLIFVFLVSISAVVAQDTADVSDNLTLENDDEAIAVSEDTEPLAAQSDEETATSDVSYDNTTLSVEVEVLDKNVKVGDTFRVKVTVRNTGENHAENVIAAVAFADLNEKQDKSFKLVDDDDYNVQSEDGLFLIPIGFLGSGDYEEVILTFLATESGEKIVAAAVLADNMDFSPDMVDNTTITVSEDSSNHAAAASKTLPATGNPLALLAIALICIVPYCRRK